MTTCNKEVSITQDYRRVKAAAELSVRIPTIANSAENIESEQVIVTNDSLMFNAICLPARFIMPQCCLLQALGAPPRSVRPLRRTSSVRRAMSSSRRVAFAL